RFRRVRSGVNPYHPGWAAKHADRPPDRVVDRTRHHRIETGAASDALILGWIDRLIGLDIIVALAVAVGVEDHCGPALRFRRVTGLVKQFCVDPADNRSAA